MGDESDDPLFFPFFWPPRDADRDKVLKAGEDYTIEFWRDRWGLFRSSVVVNVRKKAPAPRAKRRR